MRGWWRDFADLVLPADCGGCGRPRTALCDACRAALYGGPPRRVRPVPEPTGLPVVHAAAPYADEVRAVLLAHKERGALGLAGALGAALAGAVRAGLRAESGVERSETSPGQLLLVPVPSARRAVAARGHDPARRIALAASRELRRTGVPARVLPVLRQCRAVADQSGLNSRQRMDNLAGALEVVPGAGRLLIGRRTVLVDDLMTTGASLAEAARAWRAAGQAESEGRARRPAAGSVPLENAVPEGAAPGAVLPENVVPVSAASGTARESALGRGGGHGMWRVNDCLNAAVVAASPESFGINRN